MVVSLYMDHVRGVYSEFSDMDVVILVSLTEEKIKKISDEISDMAFEYLLRFGADISPVTVNVHDFNYWADDLPYYPSVRDEGAQRMISIKI